MAANQRWSLNFVADQFTDGRRFRILEVYDDCTLHRAPALCATRGLRAPGSCYPSTRQIKSRPDSRNGPELTLNAILEWADKLKVGWRGLD